MRNVLDKSCRENETHFVLSFFFRKSCCLWNNVEKCGGAREATDDNTIWRMCVLSWKRKAKNSHAHSPRARVSPPPPTHKREQKYVILFLFHGNNGFANAPECYVIRTCPVLSRANFPPHERNRISLIQGRRFKLCKETIFVLFDLLTVKRTIFVLTAMLEISSYWLYKRLYLLLSARHSSTAELPRVPVMSYDCWHAKYRLNNNAILYLRFK